MLGEVTDQFHGSAAGNSGSSTSSGTAAEFIARGSRAGTTRVVGLPWPFWGSLALIGFRGTTLLFVFFRVTTLLCVTFTFVLV